MAAETGGIPSAALEADFRRQLRLGFRGGYIARHRALIRSPIGPPKVLGSALLAVAALGLWVLALPLVGRFWGRVMEFSAQVLGLLGAINRPESYSLAGIRFEVPALYVPAGLPAAWLWQLGVWLCFGLLAVSLVAPQRMLPLAYLLRLVALVQIGAQIFFALRPDSFPYSAGGYLHTMLIASLFLIGLVPIVLALTYYLFDFPLARKIQLTAMIMGYLTVLTPIQYVVHAFVLYHLSLLFLPLLFFTFALSFQVFTFIAFYGWGFSWRSPLGERGVQRRVSSRQAHGG